MLALAEETASDPAIAKAYWDQLSALLRPLLLGTVPNTALGVPVALLEALGHIVKAGRSVITSAPEYTGGDHSGLQAAEAAISALAHIADVFASELLKWAETQVPAVLSALAQESGQPPRLRSNALLVLRLLVTTEPAVAQLLVTAGLLMPLLPLIGSASALDANLVVDMLLIIVTKVPANHCLALLAGQGAMAMVMALHECFLRHFNSSPSLRNDAIMVLLQLERLQLEHYPPDIIAEWLVALCAPDLRPSAAKSRGWQLGCGHADFELHKMLVLLAQRLSRHAPLRPHLIRGHFLKLLLHYLGPSTRSWTAPQYEELHVQALAVLTQVSSCFVEELAALRAPTQLLQLLATLIAGQTKSPGAIFGSTRNGFGGSLASTERSRHTGCGSHGSALRLCLGVVVALLETGSTALSQDFADQVCNVSSFSEGRFGC